MLNATRKLEEADYETVIVDSTTVRNLPAAEVGKKLLYTTDSNAVVMTLNPRDNDVIIYNRATLGAGVAITSDGVAYADLFLECIIPGIWRAYANSGIFS
jgi:hypothetical protein